MPKRFGQRGNKRGKYVERPKFDLGTPELRLKRMAALGEQRKGWPAPDLAYAESPLGCLLWQGELSESYDQAKRMYDAGISFTGWWTIVHPKSHAQGTLGQFQPKGSTDEIDPTEAESNLRAASEFLKKERQVYDAIVNTCVYQRLDYRSVEKLKTGLCRLIEWMKADRRAT